MGLIDHEVVHLAQQGMAGLTIGKQQGMVHHQDIRFPGLSTSVLHEATVTFVALPRQAEVRCIKQDAQQPA